MSLRGSYYKAPTVTSINTKRGIDPSRLGERHKVQSASSYSESGGVGRRVRANSPVRLVGRCVRSNSSKGRVGRCARSNSRLVL
ncbi:hypothetical protein F2Q70_00011393 [Brassica cretica]|uniref:Uncharacterized protein n=1 Tax=Brassica cretica TaxID=69181 RepID=A0A3N6RTF1_BRACR|nr:hypothetical protein F2Q70_00011393 [Brassica cretica]KAF3543094.1 hypothetical protein DY000_02006624 [Brassica cretica]